MKVLAVVIALCVSGTLGGLLTDEQKTILMGYSQACLAETGVDPAVVQNAKNGEIAEGDKKLQCFAACLLRNIGILDAEGVFHEEVIRAKIPAGLPQENVDAVVNSCKSLVGSNVCETGGAMFACFLKTKSFTIL